jgi:hypothetical protein
MNILRRYLVIVFLLSVSSSAFGVNFTEKECPVVGNSETFIYHLPGDRNYGQMLQENKEKKKDNRLCFKSRLEAEKAGYGRSRSGKSK